MNLGKTKCLIDHEVLTALAYVVMLVLAYVVMLVLAYVVMLVLASPVRTSFTKSMLITPHIHA